MPAKLARTGLAVFAMLFAITLLSEHVAAGRALVASASTLDLPPLREIAPARLAIAAVPVAIDSFEAAPATTTSPPVAAQAPLRTVPVVVASVARDDAFVVASWYGPGFYGNRTACGQTYTPEILGVAHLTLPCGTPLILTYGTRSITVPVIDRGPYIAGRVIDLSTATKVVLGCTDLCTLRMQIAR